MENEKHLQDIETLLKEIQELRNPWVSVSERLPENDGGILMYKKESGGFLLGWYDSVTERFHTPLHTYNPTHWMPLPNPPKV